jgi:asparagine synthase (glutamine-hydrolysing)
VTVGFSEAAFDEREVAGQVARHFATDHEEVEVTAEAAAALDKLTWHFDEPFADSSLIPTYYVSEAARRRVTVALSGDGGDESFAGYRRYLFDVLENGLRSLLPGPARGLLAAVGRVYPKADWLPRPLRARTLLRHLVLDPAESYLRSVAPVVPEVRDLLLDPALVGAAGTHDPLDRFRDLYSRAPAGDPLSRIQYIDLKTYLPDDILTKVDRAAMAVSLEVRVPLLDHEIVELGARMSPRLKLRGRTGKWVLREVLRGKVPDRVVDGGKKGFSVPLRRWMARDLARTFEERVLDSPMDELRAGEMRKIFEQHRSGLIDHGPVLFGLLALHLWRDRFLRGEGVT